MLLSGWFEVALMLIGYIAVVEEIQECKIEED